ncbi:TraB/GumN family protein [Aurantiacibacter sediminis]|uniref:TraB/GumN family protein n=1 Tax=Aurantiacibacter sediminis TaxID=2793064 RepID=A0ABS0N3W4_9SPHN|nr:TraB/GumN family protein [Aurantiacibacter sediminis]MBH5322659.1 TraB/GumN family protein [Aurantiacibacter sediminis]
MSHEGTTIYIFGTVALLPQGMDWQTPLVSEAFRKADELVLELRTPSPVEAALAAQEHTELASGQTLTAILPEDVRSDFEMWVRERSYVLSDFEQFQPWFASLLVSGLSSQDSELRFENQPDAVFTELAEERELPITSLETIGEQYAVFSGLSMEEQVAELRTALALRDDTAELTFAMVEAWSVGDMDRLDAIMRSRPYSPVLWDRLMTSRSARWGEWVLSRLDSPGTVFMVVTAGHLAGTDSLVSSLETADAPISQIQ